MHLLQEKFLALLNEGDAILDFGCDCGRDAKYFLEKGYHGTARDGSAECVRLASEYTGIEVKEMLFQELKENETADILPILRKNHLEILCPKEYRIQLLMQLLMK